MSLEKYRAKRNFDKTSEPNGENTKKSKILEKIAKKPENLSENTKKSEKTKKSPREERVFCVQFHRASHDHYDFRLQWRGVLLSWAVPKGPSLNPADKRLAVRVEDHPLDYASFEGVIPKGEYGAGSVMVWDFGTWESEGDFAKGLKEGNVKFRLFGERLKGGWTLVRLNDEKNWLLIKERDEHSEENFEIKNFETSVLTGRNSQEILENKKHSKIKKSKKISEKSLKNAQKIEKIEKNIKNSEKISENKNLEEPKIGEKKAKTEIFSLINKISPQLAKMTSQIPQGKNWFYEVKFDGFRAFAFVEGGEVRLISRNKHDFSEKFAEITRDLGGFLQNVSCVLDGEIISVDEEGKSDFQALQNHFRAGEEANVVYVLFDILYLNGEDLREKPLIKRKEILEKLLAGAPATLQFSQHTIGSGEVFFKAAKRLRLEGIVAKKSDSRYSCSRSDDWLKLKCRQSEEFVVGGFAQSEKRQISSLLLGAYKGQRLEFCGRVGTGINERESGFLLEEFKGLASKKSPFDDEILPKKGEKIVFLKPKLVVEVDFAEITKAKLLRQASFKGLRGDKNAEEILIENIFSDKKSDSESAEEKGAKIEEKINNKKNRKKSENSEKLQKNTEKLAKNSQKIAKNSIFSKNDFSFIEISSPERVIFKEKNITKNDVAEYYKLVAKRMFPFLQNRLLSVVRAHEGLETFFKKHPNTTALGEEVVRVKNSEGKELEYFYLSQEIGILSEVQLGTLEFHPWGSKMNTLEKPDFMVFDLDPDEGLSLEAVCDGVLDLRNILSSLGLKSYLKTSGGKGYHVCVPFKSTKNWQVFHDFSEKVALLLEEKFPSRYTTNIRKDSRKGKIFVDFLRNTRGSTSVAPYSLRARENAGVSAPIFFSELGTVAPNSITLENFAQRLKKRDPWAGIFETDQILK